MDDKNLEKDNGMRILMVDCPRSLNFDKKNDKEGRYFRIFKYSVNEVVEAAYDAYPADDYGDL